MKHFTAVVAAVTAATAAAFVMGILTTVYLQENFLQSNSSPIPDPDGACTPLTSSATALGIFVENNK